MGAPKRVGCVVVAAWIALLACSPAEALGPDNVAVVVNSGSWASRAVAEAFVTAHDVPRRNVILLSDVPGYEHVGVDEFREKLLKPVLKAIEDRGLANQIDCVAWSSDFPYAVDVQSDAAAAKITLPQVITPAASINGLTFLYEQVLAKDPKYLDLNANWYFRPATLPSGRAGPPRRRMNVTAEEQAKFREAMKLLQEKKWSDASPILAVLAKDHPGEMQLQYNLACCLAREEKPDEAMKALTAAVEAGWFDREHTAKDEDLESLRGRQDFKDLVAKMVPPVFEVATTTGFRSADRWNEKGERVAEGGRRYLLSTMLAVTSGRGTSVADTVKQFRESAKVSEGASPIRSGTVYFVKNGDVRSRTREWGFASAVAALQKLGVKAEVIDGTLPPKKDDVAGAMIGIADFDWPKSESRILPGAIVEHLTSFGGVMREHSGQTPLSAFLKHGAAGASGTVTEPYAIQAKFPSPFIQVHYARGVTLAEAFYQSVQGPYQLLIVGDPLCSPWGTKAARAEVPGETKETPAVDSLSPALSETVVAAVAIDEAKLVEGLLLVRTEAGDASGENPAVIADTREGDWLAKAGLQPGQSFELKGTFQTSGSSEFPAQFQLAGNCNATVKVDGQTLKPTADARWQYLPVRAKDGWHRVSIEGTAPKDPNAKPQLSIRYGSDGTQSLDGKRFRHEKP